MSNIRSLCQEESLELSRKMFTFDDWAKIPIACAAAASAKSSFLSQIDAETRMITLSKIFSGCSDSESASSMQPRAISHLLRLLIF
jgi:hypothetical protein